MASQTLLRLLVGLPHAVVTSSQCCTSAAKRRDQTRTIWRSSVEPLSTATRSCDFHRLNNSSPCQLSRYKTTASSEVIKFGGTFVIRIVQSHQANRSSVGSCPDFLIIS